MITFFRRIRQKLISQGKTAKYIKYALGEIVLVVIGILIALQINTWNENKKTVELSKTYLNQIKKDLIADTITFRSGINRINNSLLAHEDLFNLEKVNRLPIDSILNTINTAFHSSRIYKINNATFLKMTNSGFVESKSFNEIFIDINDYYTKEYNTWSEYLAWDKQNGETVHKPETLILLYDKIDFLNFEKEPKTESDTSLTKQYELIFRDYFKSPRFRNYVWNSNKEMQTMLERMKYQKGVTSKLIERINDELSN